MDRSGQSFLDVAPAYPTDHRRRDSDRLADSNGSPTFIEKLKNTCTLEYSDGLHSF